LKLPNQTLIWFWLTPSLRRQTSVRLITDAAGRVRNAEASMANGEAAVKSAKANLENAKAKFNRVSDLYKQDLSRPRTSMTLEHK